MKARPLPARMSTARTRTFSWGWVNPPLGLTPYRTGRLRAPASGALPASWMAWRSCSSSSSPTDLGFVVAKAHPLLAGGPGRGGRGSLPLRGGAGLEEEVEELGDADLAAAAVALADPVQGVELAPGGVAH